MHSFSETRNMPYSASLINSIVLDVEKYPDFLPWCNKATIISRDKNYLTAKLEISFKGFTESYVSKVYHSTAKEQYLIEAVAISGPFKHLSNVWSINKQNKCSKVKFSIDFEFKSRILNMVIGMVFSIATEKMIAAFESRAKELSEDLV